LFAIRYDFWYLQRMIRTAVIAALVGLAGRALADDAAQGALRLDVAVGETVERDVGFAIGLLCDDLSIIRADLRASTPESNKFSVTGVKQGTTLCRVGTAPSRPSYVFEIHVVAARRRR
jgi:hypothetical protein